MQDYCDISQERIIKAFQGEEIYLVYQPIVDLNTLDIIGYEALARWDQGCSPDKLFSYIEGYQIKGVSQHLAQKVEESEKKLKKKIHLNLIYSDLFHGFNSNITSVEITESILSDNAIDLIKQLCEKYEVWIDDAFRGYSALAWAPQLKLSGVKLDKILADFLLTVYKERYIFMLEGIRHTSHKLNVPVVCEGIETEEQAKILKRIGFEYAQGYLFGRPEKLMPDATQYLL